MTFLGSFLNEKVFRLLQNHLSLGQFQMARAMMKLWDKPQLEAFLKDIFKEGIPNKW